MSLRPTTAFDLLPAPSRAERRAAAAMAFRGADGFAEGERMGWPRAALVVGGVSLVLWAGIVHLALRVLGG